MAIGTYLGVGGVKELKECYVGVGGAVRSVKEIYVGVGGVPKLVWSSGINPPNGVEGTYTAGEAISAGDFIILEGNTAYIAYCAPFHGIAKTSASSGSSITIIKPTGGA